ncbi:MAG: MBOAT family protein [Eubacterium sp.]|nr:MBOAT family protein [Eubacterium sp.]
MLFSSNIFIFVFLPSVILIYYTLLRSSRNAQNIFLFLASIFFYAWGEPKFVLVMLLSITASWFFGLMVDKYREDKPKAHLFIVADVAFNLFVIFIFKYLMFTAENINFLFGRDVIKVPYIMLPIGISFFTFQAMSYVIDIYRKDGKAQKSIINVGLYIAFFPQLIAGPIVRYQTVSEQIQDRKETLDDFADGVTRFIIGFSKKVLIANNMAVIADQAFSTAGDNSFLMAWLGAVAYTFQIYFDFGGYSDMAIGLGKMFGFHFLENFNYPYISKSATEFWRRWHISLSTWFRDYLYIPLGGNRVDSAARHIFNIFFVWLMTGIWHGANWTFIAWGLMWFCLLIFEKYSGFDIKDESHRYGVLRHVYLMFFAILGWVIFRADNITQAFVYMKNMFFIGTAVIDDAFLEYFRQYALLFIIAAVASTPVVKWIGEKKWSRTQAAGLAGAAVLAVLFLVSVSFLVKDAYNPFIYFNF